MLTGCLKSLAAQSRPADEVIVVWQGDDFATKLTAEQFAGDTTLRLKVVHQPEPGIVPAENAGLAEATGDIVFLIDDDARAPEGWLARHLALYDDVSVGAVGGSYVNFRTDNTPNPPVAPKRIGELTWYGGCHGNLQDHLPEWKNRQPIPVVHLIGGNMSLRRCAFHRFDSTLKPYWALFEMEACLQVSRRGYRVMFDFGNPVFHYPSHRVTIPERLTAGYAFNLAYNHALILSRHSPWWLRGPRLCYLLLVGSSTTHPGFVGFLVGLLRHRNLPKQFSALKNCLRSHVCGWIDGSKTRTLPSLSHIPTEAESEFHTLAAFDRTGVARRQPGKVTE